MSKGTSLTQHVSRIAVLTAAVMLLAIPSFSQVQSATGSSKGFFQSLVGEWIGTCEQSTDNQPAENKYFHIVVKQLDPNTFQSNFDYYRMDAKTLAPIPIGQSSVTTTITPQGTAQNKITGKGIMYVDKKLKNQDHELTEVLSFAGDGTVQGQGSGKLNVYGMTLGFGKNGKIKNATSTWKLSNGVLTIDQSLLASFRALFITKKFDFDAHYTARRGSDVAKLMTKPAQVSLNK